MNNINNLPIYFIGEGNEDENSCKLTSSIKSQYYKHSYEPSPVYENLKQFYKEEDLKEIFNLTKRINCCKCIAISLYYKENRCGVFENEKIYDYLISIFKTTVNVDKNLPEWVVRLYIDGSVKKYLDKCQSINNKVYEKIINMPNVEIYTYKCEKMSIDGKLRTYRFIPFIDETVSTYIIREADGIVTNMDCRNIEIFSNSNKLFYLPELNNGETNKLLRTDDVRQHYQSWLTKMKSYMYENSERFPEESKQYIYQDLLAGIFSSNLKINFDYLKKKVKLANEIINVNITDYKDICMIKMENQKMMHSGYDEILLYLLFNKFTTFKIDEKNIVKDRFNNIAYNVDNILFIEVIYENIVYDIFDKLREMGILLEKIDDNNDQYINDNNNEDINDNNNEDINDNNEGSDEDSYDSDFDYDDDTDSQTGISKNNIYLYIHIIDSALSLNKLNKENKEIINIGFKTKKIKYQYELSAYNSILLNLPYSILIFYDNDSLTNFQKFEDYYSSASQLGGFKKEIQKYYPRQPFVARFADFVRLPKRYEKNNISEDYFKKYIKYKTKYINLLDNKYMKYKTNI